MTIHTFAKAQNLVIEVRERDEHSPAGNTKYYAYFKRVEVKDGQHMLVSAMGNGMTKRSAVKDYAKRISGRTMLYDNLRPRTRREIQVPKLT